MLRPNRFGLAEAAAGVLAWFVLGSLAVAVFGRLSHHPHHPGTFGSEVTGLVVEWACWTAAALGASWLARRRADPAPPAAASAPPATPPAGAGGEPAPSRQPPRGRRRPVWPAWMAWLRDDYGLSLRWPDVPLGAAIGVLSQYLLVPAVESPLLPFVPHLAQRLGGPAQQRTVGSATGASLAVISVLVCAGSPLFEELFFRGLLLRAIAGALGGPGRWRAVASVAVVGVLFGLVHFETLQLPGLIAFGLVLATLAWRSGRLGPAIVAHAAFNTVAVLQLTLDWSWLRWSPLH